MANTIITKNSSTASAVPTSGDLVQGELAVNVTDKRLFTENSGGTVVEVGTNPSSIAVAGNATVGGTLGVTGLATLASSTLTANPTLSAGTANGVTYLNGSKVLTSGSALTFDGTNLGIGIDSPIARIHALDRASSGLDHLGSFVGGTANTSGAGAYIGIGNSTGTTRGVRIAGINTSGNSGAHDMALYTNVASTAPEERVRITSDGAVGIGTSSPSRTLHVNSGSTDIVALFESSDSPASISFYDGTGGTNINSAGNEIYFRTSSTATGSGGTERFRITSVGDVGINTNAPFSGNGTNFKTLNINGIKGGALAFSRGTNSATAQWQVRTSDDEALRFEYGASYATERMRIDSSGNLLVGKTVSTFSVAGIGLLANDQILATATSDNPLALNRLTTDGDIARFYKDSVQVGSIGFVSTGLYIQGETAHSGFRFGGSQIIPFRDGADTDNTTDLGASSVRFDDIYATNGTIQTSDRNEKQDIETLSEAEARVAVACKGLLRKFRWKDSVAKKGDEARIHFGIIAQDLQDAFAAEGLDAGRYAMFISSTWTDEETGEERTRLGVRYPELLAFIIAAI